MHGEDKQPPSPDPGRVTHQVQEIDSQSVSNPRVLPLFHPHRHGTLPLKPQPETDRDFRRRLNHIDVPVRKAYEKPSFPVPELRHASQQKLPIKPETLPLPNLKHVHRPSVEAGSCNFEQDGTTKVTRDHAPGVVHDRPSPYRTKPLNEPATKAERFPPRRSSHPNLSQEQKTSHEPEGSKYKGSSQSQAVHPGTRDGGSGLMTMRGSSAEQTRKPTGNAAASNQQPNRIPSPRLQPFEPKTSAMSSRSNPTDQSRDFQRRSVSGGMQHHSGTSSHTPNDHVMSPLANTRTTVEEPFHRQVNPSPDTREPRLNRTKSMGTFPDHPIYSMIRGNHDRLETSHERSAEYAEEVPYTAVVTRQARFCRQPNSPYATYDPRLFLQTTRSKSVDNLRDYTSPSNPIDDTQRARRIFSNEIARRKSLRPIVHYSCGHSQQTATVGVPNGESHPDMLEVVDDGRYILVGPHLDTALEEADKGALQIPLPCSDCGVPEEVSPFDKAESYEESGEADDNSPSDSSESGKTVTQRRLLDDETRRPSKHITINEPIPTISWPSTDWSTFPSTSYTISPTPHISHRPTMHTPDSFLEEQDDSVGTISPLTTSSRHWSGLTTLPQGFQVPSPISNRDSETASPIDQQPSPSHHIFRPPSNITAGSRPKVVQPPASSPPRAHPRPHCPCPSRTMSTCALRPVTPSYTNAQLAEAVRSLDDILIDHSAAIRRVISALEGTAPFGHEKQKLAHSISESNFENELGDCCLKDKLKTRHRVSWIDQEEHYPSKATNDAQSIHCVPATERGDRETQETPPPQQRLARHSFDFRSSPWSANVTSSSESTDTATTSNQTHLTTDRRAKSLQPLRQVWEPPQRRFTVDALEAMIDRAAAEMGFAVPASGEGVSADTREKVGDYKMGENDEGRDTRGCDDLVGLWPSHRWRYRLLKT